MTGQKRVPVQYLGNTENLTLKLPWLSEKVVFADADNRTAEMYEFEAARLVEENPRGFRLITAAPQQQTEPEVEQDQDPVEIPAEQVEQTDDAGVDEASDEAPEQSADDVLGAVRRHIDSLEDKQAIVQFCQETYGIADLNPRRSRENLTEDAVEAIAGVMDTGGHA